MFCPECGVDHHAEPVIAADEAVEEVSADTAAYIEADVARTEMQTEVEVAQIEAQTEIRETEAAAMVEVAEVQAAAAVAIAEAQAEADVAIAEALAEELGDVNDEGGELSPDGPDPDVSRETSDGDVQAVGVPPQLKEESAPKDQPSGKRSVSKFRARRAR